MRRYDLKVSKEYELPAGEAIITAETGTDMMVNNEWRPDKALVTVIGVAMKDKIFIFVREAETDNVFIDQVDYMLNFLKKSGYRLWAWIKNTKAGNLFGLLGKHYLLNELCPVNKRWRIDSFYQALFDRNIVERPKYSIYDPIPNPMDCINTWQLYLETKDKSLLTKLMLHTHAILLKEMLIFNYREELSDKIENDEYKKM